MVWDGLREFHRHSCALHHKHWLSNATRMATDPQFAHAPSVSNYVVVMKEAASWPTRILTPWRQKKIKKWYSRGLVLTYARIVVLQGSGVTAPTWRQVHVSVGGQDRDGIIPTHTITDAIQLNPTV